MDNNRVRKGIFSEPKLGGTALKLELGFMLKYLKTSQDQILLETDVISSKCLKI